MAMPMVMKNRITSNPADSQMAAIDPKKEVKKRFNITVALCESVEV